MAAAETNTTTTEAPKKKRKAQGPRVEKPVFAIVTYTDSDGNTQQLNKAGLNIVLERDAGKIVDLVTSGDTQGATVVRVTMPVAPKRAPATPAA